MTVTIALPYDLESVRATQLTGYNPYVDATTGNPTPIHHIGRDASGYDFVLPISEPLIALGTGEVVSSVNVVPDKETQM